VIAVVGDSTIVVPMSLDMYVCMYGCSVLLAGYSDIGLNKKDLKGGFGWAKVRIRRIVNLEPFMLCSSYLWFIFIWARSSTGEQNRSIVSPS
jgi:hypothetical protein